MWKSKNIKKSKKYWFTLVEIIVVIAILAILWTIAFISMQGYSLNARDWTRITDMRSISKWLILSKAQSGRFPMPENFSTITASWLIIRYQGNIWKNILGSLWIIWSNQWKWVDPKTWEFYTYVIDWSRIQYNIIWYFEWSQVLVFNPIQKVSASYTWWIMKNIGTKLWMMYETVTNKPLQEKFPFWITIDVKNTTNIYKVKFDNNDEIVWTWLILYSSYYNRDRYLLNIDTYANIDDYLVWYWDMETTVLSWALNVLKDISKNWNNWVCYNWSTIVSCMKYWIWPIITNWKMSFDWTNDYVQINKNVYSETMTVLVKIKPSVFDSTRHWVFWYQDWTNNLRPFNLRMAPSQFAWNWWFHYDSHEISATSLSNACNTWKRCADNLNYQYEKDSHEVMQFYVAYTRTPPSASLNINWVPFVNRDCRNQPGPNFTDCTFPQVNTFNNFHTNFNYFRIWRVDNYFRGTIDEVRIYSRALTETEILTLYESTSYESTISIN